MTRIVLAMSLFALSVGCTGIQPIGPLAKPGPGPRIDKDDVPKVVTVPTPKPTPPLNLVDPAEVTVDPHGAAQRLMSELEGDRKTIPAVPSVAEVSHYKDGVRQN